MKRSRIVLSDRFLLRIVEVALSLHVGNSQNGHHSEELQYVPYAIGRGKRAGEKNERSEREVPGSAPKGNQNAKKEYEL